MRAGQRVAILSDPGHAEALLGDLPDGVRVTFDPPDPGAPTRGSDAAFDVVLCFVARREPLGVRFAHAARLLAWDGGLWISWPKKASPLHEDLSETEVRGHGLEAGFVDNKICAVDDDWSGLRFVHRLRDRP
jgi:hypothetical protein